MGFDKVPLQAQDTYCRSGYIVIFCRKTVRSENPDVFGGGCDKI